MSSKINKAPEFQGAVKPDAIQVDSYEYSLAALRHVSIPLNMQERFDYSGRSDGQPVYIGYGAKGIATSDSGWLLFKYTYDASGFVTLKQVSYDAWDDRATATYE